MGTAGGAGAIRAFFLPVVGPKRVRGRDSVSIQGGAPSPFLPFRLFCFIQSARC